ncbi:MULTISPECIES: iron-sulfur cluster assembly scaffold protein [Cytobacillus]|uniref:Iron-sulfur cluster assembly scaffold protein n=1 Tax=Cytobacillus horneckiae TaxID=549687 RepID=A0A2N0ZAL4_9BACI|nr:MULTISPECIES: iron-sulfur cluster assembly scaffold protein [Cytobacillus]MCA1028870.1 iron-sulfur cluster assembly scaffold protein [Cytobacillus kochii]MEC1157736.1 iron-sulfur cluster assembly scaffold protein [Cytobacillus horneckiae]NRG45662.1 iron-sulfur cluster assembly scaffold protein [Bacillus sp. CRN 9]PKG26539.1 iron-sulfur cluster assembly scaffold protein [Cytobacillus horneckiae]
MFNEIISEHFMNPRNVGKMSNPDFVIEIGNPICGDTVHMFLQVDSNSIKDVSYLSYGCSTSIATASILSEVVKGKTFNEIASYQKSDVIKWLGELEPAQNHCVDIGYNILSECAKPKQRKLTENNFLVEDGGALT